MGPVVVLCIFMYFNRYGLKWLKLLYWKLCFPSSIRLFPPRVDGGCWSFPRYAVRFLRQHKAVTCHLRYWELTKRNCMRLLMKFGTWRPVILLTLAQRKVITPWVRPAEPSQPTYYVLRARQKGSGLVTKDCGLEWGITSWGK
jgi:hypothetical protein